MLLIITTVRLLNYFIFAYKPPSKNDVVFIENLETVMLNMNLTNDIIIIGYLNMNWLCEKENKLREFCLNHSLFNYVIKPTKVQFNKNNWFSSTLIAVI